MRYAILLIPLAVLLALAACDGGEAQPTPTPSPPVAQPSPTPEPTPTATPEPRIQRLAYVGTDLDVWIMNEDDSNQQKLFDIATEQGDSVHSLRWSPDGSKFTVTKSPKDIIFIVGANGEKLLEVPAVTFLAWSPSSDTFAVARGPALEVEPAVLVLDLRGDTAVELANIQIVDQVYFSPDGRRLTFYEFVGGGGLCGDYRGLLADLQTGDFRPIDPAEEPIPCGKGPPIFSPADPFLLAYGDSLIDLDTGRVQPLPGRAVRWSPDGRFIVLAIADTQGGSGVVAQVYNVETAGSVMDFRLTTTPGDQPYESVVMGGTRWAPDGAALLSIDYSIDKPPVLRTRELATGAPQSVPLSTNGGFGFQFSADGRHLLFSSNDGGIWLADSDGSGATRMAEGSEAAWQPLP